MKPKNRVTRNLTLNHVDHVDDDPFGNPNPAETPEHREMEAIAKETALEFRDRFRKLRELKPKIQRIQDYFTNSVRGSVTLAGCSSFKEYCEKKLGRTRQAVYSLLGDYPQKKEQKKKKKVLAKPITHDNLTDEDVMRLRTAANAATRARDAEATGHKTEAAMAWTEYEKITKAEPLKSHLAGDQPNYKMMLMDLLTVTEQMLAVLQRIVDAGILTNDAVLLRGAKSCTSRGGKLCKAYHQRLGITDTNISGGVH
jgi:hypothetical protein